MSHSREKLEMELEMEACQQSSVFGPGAMGLKANMNGKLPSAPAGPLAVSKIVGTALNSVGRFLQGRVLKVHWA